MEKTIIKRIIETTERARKDTIKGFGRFAKEHPVLKYPAFIFVAAVLFVYNLLMHLFIQLGMRERLARGLALSMVFILILTSADLSVFAAADIAGEQSAVSDESSSAGDESSTAEEEYGGGDGTEEDIVRENGEDGGSGSGETGSENGSSDFDHGEDNTENGSDGSGNEQGNAENESDGSGIDGEAPDSREVDADQGVVTEENTEETEGDAGDIEGGNDDTADGELPPEDLAEQVPEISAGAAEVLFPEAAEPVPEAEDEKDTPLHDSVVTDGVRISVNADGGVFPEGAYLDAYRVTGETESTVNDAVDEVRDEDKKVAKAYTFDIRILNENGEEIEPDTTKGSVHVSFAMVENENVNLDTEIYHIEGEASDLDATLLDTDVSGDTATAETDGFSYYQVEFTYDEKQYVLAGDSSVALTEILENVGIKNADGSRAANGNISYAAGSNDELFTVRKEDGVWMAYALTAFTSEEWLRVTVDGVEYEIVVTDAVDGASVFENFADQYFDSRYYSLTDGKTYTLQDDVTLGGYILVPSGVTAPHRSL